MALAAVLRFWTHRQRPPLPGRCGRARHHGASAAHDADGRFQPARLLRLSDADVLHAGGRRQRALPHGRHGRRLDQPRSRLAGRFLSLGARAHRVPERPHRLRRLPRGRALGHADGDRRRPRHGRAAAARARGALRAHRHAAHVLRRADAAALAVRVRDGPAALVHSRRRDLRARRRHEIQRRHGDRHAARGHPARRRAAGALACAPRRAGRRRRGLRRGRAVLAARSAGLPQRLRLADAALQPGAARRGALGDASTSSTSPTGSA